MNITKFEVHKPTPGLYLVNNILTWIFWGTTSGLWNCAFQFCFRFFVDKLLQQIWFILRTLSTDTD